MPVEDMVLYQYSIRDTNEKFNRDVGKVIAIDGNVVTFQSPGKEYKVGSTLIIPLDNYPSGSGMDRVACGHGQEGGFQGIETGSVREG